MSSVICVLYYWCARNSPKEACKEVENIEFCERIETIQMTVLEDAA